MMLNHLILKYEDLLTNAFETFTKAVNFVGLNIGGKKIKQAICFSQFDELQQQEKKEGFNERKSKTDLFFRNGKSNNWQKKLDQDQIEMIMERCGKMMKKFGYR